MQRNIVDFRNITQYRGVCPFILERLRRDMSFGIQANLENIETSYLKKGKLVE